MRAANEILNDISALGDELNTNSSIYKLGRRELELLIRIEHILIELKIWDTFKKIKADLAQWKTLEKYDIDWDRIEIDKVIDDIPSKQWRIRIARTGKYHFGVSKDDKIDKFFPENKNGLPINPDEMLTFDLTQLILQAVNSMPGAHKFGHIDIIDESLGIFQLANRGFCGNDKSFEKPDKADIQLKENSFIILSKQVQMVAMDRDDIGTEHYEKEICIDDLCDVVNYEKFREKYDIGEDEFYKEVDDLCSCGYSPIDFVSDEALWTKIDNFLQANGLSDKLALVAVQEQENVVRLGVVPQLSNGLVGEVIDGDVFEIPAISEEEKAKITNFLADIRQEYADKINDKIDEALSNSYDEKLEQQTQKARKQK